MTDREILESILTEIVSIKKEMASMKDEVK